MANPGIRMPLYIIDQCASNFPGLWLSGIWKESAPLLVQNTNLGFTAAPIEFVIARLSQIHQLLTATGINVSSWAPLSKHIYFFFVPYPHFSFLLLCTAAEAALFSGSSEKDWSSWAFGRLLARLLSLASQKASKAFHSRQLQKPF